jgi:hypothetical protein
MADLLIKQEHLPTRCDICHQSDCYIPKDNYCSRCAELKEQFLFPFDPKLLIGSIINYNSLLVVMGTIIFVGIIFIILGYTAFNQKEQFYFIARGLFLLIISPLLPIKILYRQKQISWILNNIKPIKLEVIIQLFKDCPILFVQTYLDENIRKGIYCYKPKWNVTELEGKPIIAQIYCYKKKAIISTDKGILMSK